MSTSRNTAREEARGLPCVVIDRDEHGNDVVYADPGVRVFSRSAFNEDDPLYRYTPPPIPGGWLDRITGYKGDGSQAEAKAVALAGARLIARAEQIVQDP
ncbi:MAG: hypothetical protein AAFR47_20555 [Pseudomonadota bacterium]